MAAKKMSNGKPGAMSVVARELDQLRKKTKELTLRLEREAKARKLDARLAAEAKKAREQLTRQVTALRQEGQKLATGLKSALGNADKRQQALTEARDKIAELRAELVRKTGDLKRKSAELKKLVKESTHRAAAIMHDEGEYAAKPAQAEPSAEAKPMEPGSENFHSYEPKPN
jgi:chromosome segregation ATPase